MEVTTSGQGTGASGAGGEAAGTGGAAASTATTEGSAAAGGGEKPQAPGAAPETAAASVPTPYQPNLKYKVLKEEKEIPEWAKPFVTSADLEKNFKDTFEKADGIDAVKQHRDSLVQENSAMREEWAPIVQSTQTALAHLKRGDLDSFFENVGLNEAHILRYALQRLQLRENPAALQQHEQQRQLQLQHAQMQEQLTQAQSGYQNLAVQTREFELGSQLQRPEILSVVQAFEAKVGKPGAFRAEVIKRGQAYALQEIDAPVEQVVSEVLQLISWQGQNNPPVSGQNGQGIQAPAAGTEIPGAGGQQAKPVLPHLRGKGVSPVKKAAKSTQELRELARQMSAAGR